MDKHRFKISTFLLFASYKNVFFYGSLSHIFLRKMNKWDRCINKLSTGMARSIVKSKVMSGSVWVAGRSKFVMKISKIRWDEEIGCRIWGWKRARYQTHLDNLDNYCWMYINLVVFSEILPTVKEYCHFFFVFHVFILYYVKHADKF